MPAGTPTRERCTPGRTGIPDLLIRSSAPAVPARTAASLAVLLPGLLLSRVSAGAHPVTLRTATFGRGRWTPSAIRPPPKVIGI